MMFGIPPPTPRETPELMRDIFVKKEKMLEGSFVDILENNIKVRKDIEHGTKKELSGKEVDKLLSDAKKYLKRIKKLFTQIEVTKNEQDVANIYESVVTIIRDILRSEGVEKISDIEMIKVFEDEMISRGKIPAKFLRILNGIIDAKKDYDEGKLNKAEVEKVKKESRELIKFMVEYIQRKRGKELEQAKIRVKHGKKYGEVILLGKIAFIIHDIDAEERDISKAKITADGTLTDINESSLEEFEKELAKIDMIPKTFIKGALFEELKSIFGQDVEILITS
jgi:uncharacterized protein (UPF0332 family)